ncbi:LysE family translocator [Pelagibius litoralis]|uniref:LysE family translocator n=1 Tax=Pelagibius litoralis TaxID=374515 RepID=A0A967EX82_9PROT|nr:LysE family translocator [Pelagibius litoralis]NIA68195.1 LysE family translocator [Pelagibius litoralis]
MIEVVTVFLGIVFAQAAPGPNMMAVAAASLGSGRFHGVATAAGIASGVFIWAILFALGIGAVLQAFPQTVMAMRLLGGGYLLYLGLRALRAAVVGSGDAAAAGRSEVAGAAAYGRGFLVVMTNPKAALMWVAVSMFLVSSGLSTLQFLAVGLGASASAMIIYGTYALLFSTGIALRAYGRFSRLVEGTFGALFGAAGGKLILDGVREMRS